MRTFLEDNDLTGKKIAVMVTSAGGDTSKCIAALKQASKADSFLAELSLVDPKDHPSEENEKKISEFAEKIRSAGI